MGSAPSRPGRARIVAVLGVTQILFWGSSYYLLAILAAPIARDTGWSPSLIAAALSIGLLVEGLAAPLVGRAIDRWGGRPVMAAGAIVVALGLIGLASATSPAAFAAAWLLTGIGMAACLYDAAFSTLVRLFGFDARRLITLLTLLGGFASTVCWPLTAFLEAQLGWRGACAVYAAANLIVCLPAILVVLPSEPRRPLQRSSPAPVEQRAGPPRSSRFVLIAASFSISAMISSVMSVHLVAILQARGAGANAALAIAALMGPAQVAARIVEMLAGQRHHPVQAMIIAAGLIVAGLGALWAGLPGMVVAVIAYGGGMGIRSIVRGSVPLAVFGVQGYAVVMGRLAMPVLLLGAVAPFLGAVALERFGVDVTLAGLTAAAAASLGFSLALRANLGHQPALRDAHHRPDF